MADKKEEVKKEVRAVKLKLKEKPNSKSDAAKEKKEEDMLFVPEIIIYNHETHRNETYAECQAFCHKDFTKAVLSLREHYAILLTFYEVEDFETGSIDPKKFKSRGFSISGAEDETRLCLKGYFLTDLAGACSVNVNNIFLEKDMDAEGGYDLIDDLKVKIDRIKLEAIAYLFEKKQREDPQLSMKFPDGEKVTTAKIAPHVDVDPSMNSPEAVAAAIVAETNKNKPAEKKERRVPQSPKHKSGIVKE